MGLEVFGGLLASSNSQYHTEKYLEYVNSLETRLLALLEVAQGDLKSTPDQILFPLVSLIYLERVSRNCSGKGKKIDTWVDSGFEILHEMPFCRHPMLLLFLGLEARTDVHRTDILRVIHATKKRTNMRNIELLLGMLESAWNQDDLSIDQNELMPYNTKLNTLVSAYEGVPAFL